MPTAIIALILSGLGLLGAGLVGFFRIVAHLTRIENTVKQFGAYASHVPNLNYRMTRVENHCDLEPLVLPIYSNGHLSEE